VSRYFITLRRLRIAVRKVEREIKRLGLWHEAMDECQIYLIPIHWYYGYHMPRTGAIYVPRISGSAWFETRPWSLTDVLTHEYGHVLGQSVPDYQYLFDATESVSEYGHTNPAEDFAETFRYYVKHRGKLPKKLKTEAIKEKWRFIAQLRTT
jgi:hypothetical protein